MLAAEGFLGCTALVFPLVGRVPAVGRRALGRSSGLGSGNVSCIAGVAWSWWEFMGGACQEGVLRGPWLRESSECPQDSGTASRCPLTG